MRYIAMEATKRPVKREIPKIGRRLKYWHSCGPSKSLHNVHTTPQAQNTDSHRSSWHFPSTTPICLRPIHLSGQMNQRSSPYHHQHLPPPSPPALSVRLLGRGVEKDIVSHGQICPIDQRRSPPWGLTSRPYNLGIILYACPCSSYSNSAISQSAAPKMISLVTRSRRQPPKTRCHRVDQSPNLFLSPRFLVVIFFVGKVYEYTERKGGGGGRGIGWLVDWLGDGT